MTENDAGASVDKTPEREALEHIVAVLEPLYWQCPDHNCKGCQYEHDEALVTAMNIIAGVPPEAQFGPAVAGKWVNGKMTFEYPDGYEEEVQAWRDRLHGYWRAAGFVEDTSGERTLWRRGTAV